MSNYYLPTMLMPANKKYLSSPQDRILKISAGFIGGYSVVQTLHLLLVVYWNTADALLTLRFAGFVLWTVLLIVSFLSKSGWKIWGIYVLISLVFIIIIYYKQPLII